MNAEERKTAEALAEYVTYCAAQGRQSPVLLSETEQRLLAKLMEEKRQQRGDV